MSGDTRGTDIFDKLHEYAVDLKRRRVFMQTPFYPSWMKQDDGLSIETGWADGIVRNILWLDANSAEPIELWLNTPGGEIDEMWAIYDAMRTAGSLVHTVAIGNVSSAGCLVLAGGTGTRYAFPNASFMWHGGWQGVSGELRTVEKRVEWYKREMARWIDTMASHTAGKAGRSLKARREFWEERTHDWEAWFEAKDMKAHGIIDEIWEGER
jgi:ATP-dependent Clp protease protease subunit